jgi:hypothetical protein
MELGLAIRPMVTADVNRLKPFGNLIVYLAGGAYQH